MRLRVREHVDAAAEIDAAVDGTRTSVDCWPSNCWTRSRPVSLTSSRGRTLGDPTLASKGAPRSRGRRGSGASPTASSTSSTATTSFSSPTITTGSVPGTGGTGSTGDWLAVHACRRWCHRSAVEDPAHWMTRMSPGLAHRPGGWPTVWRTLRSGPRLHVRAAHTPRWGWTDSSVSGRRRLGGPDGTRDLTRWLGSDDDGEGVDFHDHARPGEPREVMGGCRDALNVARWCRDAANLSQRPLLCGHRRSSMGRRRAWWSDEARADPHRCAAQGSCFALCR